MRSLNACQGPMRRCNTPTANKKRNDNLLIQSKFLASRRGELAKWKFTAGRSLQRPPPIIISGSIDRAERGSRLQEAVCTARRSGADVVASQGAPVSPCASCRSIGADIRQLQPLPGPALYRRICRSDCDRI